MTAIFDGWARRPPEGEWAYEVDDFGIVYGPGPWPWYRKHDDAPAERTSVRLAPDVEYRAWRNEYVGLYPVGVSCGARLTLWHGPQGQGGMVETVHVTINLTTLEGAIESCPPELLEQAERKVKRIGALIAAARRERDAGAEGPTTAYDRSMYGSKQEE